MIGADTTIQLGRSLLKSVIAEQCGRLGATIVAGEEGDRSFTVRLGNIQRFIELQEWLEERSVSILATVPFEYIDGELAERLYLAIWQQLTSDTPWLAGMPDVTVPGLSGFRRMIEQIPMRLMGQLELLHEIRRADENVAQRAPLLLQLRTGYDTDACSTKLVSDKKIQRLQLRALPDRAFDSRPQRNEAMQSQVADALEWLGYSHARVVILESQLCDDDMRDWAVGLLQARGLVVAPIAYHPGSGGLESFYRAGFCGDFIDD